MGENSAIAWTDHTFNPWWGCARVSPGCENCYAESWAKRYGTAWGVSAERRFFGDKHWHEPVKWNASATRKGVRARVFCSSMADVFERRGDLDAQRERLWTLIAATPWLDWLLLTKRPGNISGLLPDDLGRDNIWLGTTTEDQRCADERLPHLLRNRAAQHFASYEPGLGDVDFARYLRSGELPYALSWLIVGGESGPNARPFDLAWARSAVAQCKAAGVACFVKQLGREPFQTRDDARKHGTIMFLGDRKGGDMDEWPADLRVREFPR